MTSPSQSHSSLVTTLQSVITMAERAVISSEDAMAAARLAGIHANSALEAAKLALLEVEISRTRHGPGPGQITVETDSVQSSEAGAHVDVPETLVHDADE